MSWGNMTAANGGKTPSFTSGCANLALGVARTTSANPTNSEPAPIAGPFTTTTTGLEMSTMAWKTRVKASRVWNTRSGRESSSEMPAEKADCEDCKRMAFTSPRPFRLSMASAISFIMGTVSTLCGAWLSVRRAMKFLISNWMYLNGCAATLRSPVSASGTVRVDKFSPQREDRGGLRADYPLKSFAETSQQFPYNVTLGRRACSLRYPKGLDLPGQHCFLQVDKLILRRYFQWHSNPKRRILRNEVNHENVIDRGSTRPLDSGIDGQCACACGRSTAHAGSLRAPQGGKS